MNARALVPIATLHIVTDPATATLTCHVCGTPPRPLRGRTAVAEYVRSNPLHEHRPGANHTLIKENPMLTIPDDLDAWDPTDVTTWLDQLNEDATVTDAEYARAQAAVMTALVGPTTEEATNGR